MTESVNEELKRLTTIEEDEPQELRDTGAPTKKDDQVSQPPIESTTNENPGSAKTRDQKRLEESGQAPQPPIESTADIQAEEETKASGKSLSAVFAVLGIVGAFVCWFLVQSLIAFGWELWAASAVSNGGTAYIEDQTILAKGTCGIFCAMATLIYLSSIYRSLFTENPKLSSKNAVSFWNFFFGSLVFGEIAVVALIIGGIVFGSLLNTAVRKKRSGAARGILIGFSILVLLWSFYSLTDISSPYTREYNPSDGTYGHLKTPYASVMTTEKTDSKSYKNNEAGFSVEFPTTPQHNSESSKAYGFDIVNETWYSGSGDNFYMVSMISLPADYPALDNANGINGGLSSMLVSLNSTFDVPTDNANVRFDEFLGCPSAITSFSFEGKPVIGRSLFKNNKVYMIVAGANTTKECESFISTFKLL